MNWYDREEDELVRQLNAGEISQNEFDIGQKVSFTANGKQYDGEITSVSIYADMTTYGIKTSDRLLDIWELPEKEITDASVQKTG